MAFANEETPFYRSDAMGSRRYARCSKKRGVIAMFSLETIGYYSDQPGSQRYPFPLGLFYPASGGSFAFTGLEESLLTARPCPNDRLCSA